MGDGFHCKLGSSFGLLCGNSADGGEHGGIKSSGTAEECAQEFLHLASGVGIEDRGSSSVVALVAWPHQLQLVWST